MNIRDPNRILYVNLSDEEVTSQRIPDMWQQKYIGGKGLGARYLYEELSAEVDPLDPDNCLLFMRGPLSGMLPGETRYAAITKSPLTGGFLDSYSGGTFASRLTTALGEHMGVIITGQASEMSVLRLRDGEASIYSAPELEGLNTVELSQHFEDTSVAGIGPAGEHQVSYATIASEYGEHQAGRGGAGAVMGSKRLKAVIADGPEPDPHPELTAYYRDQYLESDTGKWQSASGTVETIDFADEVGVLSTRGWQEGTFENAEELGVQTIQELANEREHNDPVPGGYRLETEDGPFVPRGATAMSLGAELGLDEFDAVKELGQACDRLGIDVISAGNVIAWAVLAANEGHIDRNLKFGDHDALQSLLSTIATRETTLGDVLADGVNQAATEYGGKTLIPTIKAMDSPPYDPRGSISMALAYATSDRGACHRRALPVETEAFDRDNWTVMDRVNSVIEEQTINAVLWSLIADSFVGEAISTDLGAALLNELGYQYDPVDLLNVGRRTWTTTRLFNIREGFDRTDDQLPRKFTQPLQGGPADGSTVTDDEFEILLQLYYHLRGWSSDGRPTDQVLQDLQITDLPDEDTPIDTTIAQSPIISDESDNA